MNEDVEMLELERKELNALIERGVKFNVTIKTRKSTKGIKGLFGKKDIVEKTIEYEIHEPTLSTLDRISDIALDIIIVENDFKNENDIIAKARQLSKKNAKRLAHVIAIAVLGEDCYVTELSKSGAIKRHGNDKEINKLTDLFFHTIKPSKLIALANVVTNISNFPDFISSMRLISGARTTQPIKDHIE
ncbi:MAG: hypothetical protein LBC68_08120 [Prevotellaceae bacterium]|jgi:hypothetical protein|nr:hypothetical protein [Prevotellaceae bacterium]